MYCSDIRGNSLYTEPSGASGFAFELIGNNNITSYCWISAYIAWLAHCGADGLGNLKGIEGSGTIGQGKVKVQSNAKLCYTENV